MRPTVVAACVCLLVVAALLLSSSSAAVGRGEASPIPDVAFVSAADCRATPRPLADFEANATATPLSLTEVLLRAEARERPGTPPPGGVPADPVVVAGVADAIQQAFACLFTGDIARYASLLSDENFRRNFHGLDPRALAGTPEAISVRVPLPLGQIEEILVLPDGRIAVRTQRERGPSLTFYVESNGRYLLDGGLELVEGTTRTPVPQQESTAEPDPGQGVVDPADCRAEPRPLADFAAIADATPGSFARLLDGTPVATVVPPEGGEPVAPEVAAAIDAALQQIGACTATRDVRLFSALWTDAFFRETLSGGDLGDVLTGTPEAVTEPIPVPTVEAVRELPDGRFAATVRSEGGRGIALFVEQDGRYLVDGSFDLTPDGTPTP